ncbi:MAG: amidase [Paracoccaceae bacterium]
MTVGHATLAELSRRLGTGRSTAAELARRALSRIAARDGDIRAFIMVDAEGALAAAQDSDRRRAAGHAAGPFDGVPVALKDNIDVRGLPTTSGTRFWAGRIAATDSRVAARLRAAGLVILGKLNLHEGALGATTDNPFWGRCANPAAPGLTPGGSSGGSAAAVAAGYVPMAIGTDTMGSVRIPAAYCGLWGLKPTPGVVPTGGLRFLSPTLDSIGPIAATGEDLALAASLLTGAVAGRAGLAGARFGVPDEAMRAEIAPGVRAAFTDFCERLAAEGAEVRQVSVAGWDPGGLRRAGLLVAEAEAGALYGADLDRGGDGFSDQFRALVAYGRAARPEKIAAARASLARAERSVAGALAGIDALLMPTAPQLPFPHGAPVPPDQADLTALANAARAPAVAFPIAVPGGGHPASAQLVGPAGSEARLIALARAAVGEGA